MGTMTILLTFPFHRPAPFYPLLSLSLTYFIRTVSRADWCIVKAGIGGTKYALDKHIEQGLGGYPRTPIPEADEAVMKMVDSGMQEALALEASL